MGPPMICPHCGKFVRVRYCNDGHPMRRTRAMTEAELEAWQDAQWANDPRPRMGGDANAGMILAMAMMLGSFGGGRR